MIDLKEIFLPLRGFKGADILSEKYKVSNYGKVYDIINHRFCKLSLCGDPQYYYLTLTHKNVRKTARVNRLVALSFIPNPKNLPIADHIDRDRLNNYTGNLRWTTRSKNQLNSDRVDKGKVNYFVRECNKFVKIFNDRRDKKREYHRIENIKERIIYKWKYEYVTKVQLSEEYNIDITKIYKILSGINGKERKIEWKISKEWVRNYYLKNCIRKKYSDGFQKIRKLSEEFGVSTSTIDAWVADLPSNRRKTLSKELRKEIHGKYISGSRQCDLIKEYNISKGQMRNIKDRIVDF